MHVALSVVFCVVFSPLVFSRVHACCSLFCFLCSVFSSGIQQSSCMLLCIFYSVQCFLLWYVVEFMHVALSFVFCVVFSPLVFSKVLACCSVFCFLCSVFSSGIQQSSCMLLCLLFSVQCLVEFMHVALSVVFCVVFSRVHTCCSVCCFLCSVQQSSCMLLCLLFSVQCFISYILVFLFFHFE